MSAAAATASPAPPSAHAVAAFADDVLAPRAAADDASERFPRDLFDRMAALGLTRLPHPLGVGGLGQPLAAHLRVLERLARGHVVAALTASVHTLATGVVVRAGADAVDGPLRALVAGEALAAYCLSEPHSGSDAAALRTVAVRDGDAYVLHGTKAWVTHGGVADWYVVVARVREPNAPAPTGSAGISAFLVPAGAAGMHPAPPERKLGLAASPTAPIHLDGVRVPAIHRLGAEGAGLRLALDALDRGRLAVAAIAVGLAQRAVDATIARLRPSHAAADAGPPQGTAFRVADMATAVEAARGLVRAGAEGLHAGDVTCRAAMAKLAATDAAMRVAHDAVDVHELDGVVRGATVERLLREAKALQIVEGTNQIQRHVIARGLLGSRR